MWLRTQCTLSFDIEIPTPFILMLRPRSGAQQWVAREEYRMAPWSTVFEHTDPYGNLCQRMTAQPGRLDIYTAAEVKTSDQMDAAPGAPFTLVQDLPDSVLNFLLPSRYCESDRFGIMAADITANLEPGYDQVAGIEQWVRENVRFDPYCAENLVSATEINSSRIGVCRDLAHIGIALCRSLSIPARMVVGYLNGLKPMDLHAWFEAYVNGRWYTFDPTQPELRGGYMAIGYGRDAADVAVYNQFGPAVIPLSQTITVERIEGR